jgi:hypothetical protein
MMACEAVSFSDPMAMRSSANSLQYIEWEAFSSKERTELCARAASVFFECFAEVFDRDRLGELFRSRSHDCRRKGEHRGFAII